MTNILENDNDIKVLLEETKIIAVVGLSPNPDRPSYGVAAYLQSKGYKIVPVRPGVEEVLGEKAFASLEQIPFPVDMVDVFRKPEHVPPIFDEAIKIGAKSVWLQQGIRHDEAAAKAANAGLKVVQDKCALVEHKKLF
jgi:uncharacterized protein